MNSSKMLSTFILIALLGTVIEAHTFPRNADEPWISHYRGDIEEEAEMAYLDNFAIQITNDPNLIGYILIYSGEDSCRGEAEARALRMKDYLMQVRGVPWDKVMWKHAGRYQGKGVEVFHLGIPKGKLAEINFPYEPPPNGHTMPKCRYPKKGGIKSRRG